MSTWCSKHVQALNKLIVKQKFCASSWLITKINTSGRLLSNQTEIRNWHLRFVSDASSLNKHTTFILVTGNLFVKKKRVNGRQIASIRSKIPTFGQNLNLMSRIDTMNGTNRLMSYRLLVHRDRSTDQSAMRCCYHITGMHAQILTLTPLTSHINSGNKYSRIIANHTTNHA